MSETENEPVEVDWRWSFDQRRSAIWSFGYRRWSFDQRFELRFDRDSQLESMASENPTTDYLVTTSIRKKRVRSDLQHDKDTGGDSGSPHLLSDTDIQNLEVMTVQDLRSKLRSIGLPAKGRKSVLISALKCFLTKENPKMKCDVLPQGRSNISPTSKESWTLLSHKKPHKEWTPYNPIVMRAPPLPPQTKYMKLMSWNVNGLRALLKTRDFSGVEFAKAEDFDVLCLQETKLQEKDVKDISQCLLNGYEHSYWTCSVSKLGYSGTAIISRIKPISVRYGLGIADHDSEGRLLTAEFDKFFLLNAYVPNSGDGLKRLSYRVTQWDPSLSSYMKELEKSKPVILAGDLNCAHEEIDIYNPAGNRRSAGFTDEERGSFGSSFLTKGFVDTFRSQHPNVVGYTYWGYRHGGRKSNKEKRQGGGWTIFWRRRG